MNIHVPDRFRRKVIMHAVSVLSAKDYPLLLAIQGPPGDGKSYQLRHVLKSHGFAVLSNSSALLAGSFEGEPVRQLRELYGRARDLAANNPDRHPVIVLEDFDLSPAGRDYGVRYTVNSQLLTGFLMNLADDIASCDVGTTARFPIFLTGNNFALIHGPLMRAGRMNIFTWEPTEVERLNIIQGMLSPYISELSSQDLMRIFKHYRRYPISLFHAAIMDCIGFAVLAYTERTQTIDITDIQYHLDGGVAINLDDYLGALRDRTDPSAAPRSFSRARI